MNVLKGLKIINGRIDTQVKQAIRHSERADNLKIQCRKGCNYCCNLMVSVTVSEAIGIFNAIGIERIRELAPKLIADAKALADPSMTLIEWTNRWQPCHIKKWLM